MTDVLLAAEPSFVNYRQYLVNFTLLEIGLQNFWIQAVSLFKVTKPLFNISLMNSPRLRLHS